jgi:hypothetical protein
MGRSIALEHLFDKAVSARPAVTKPQHGGHDDGFATFRALLIE